MRKTSVYPCAFALWALFSPKAGMAQKPTFYADIQPILARHCITCHRPGEIGPFPLLEYDDVAKRATFIAEVTAARYMPPWKADPNFQTYHNQRILPQADIQKIADWAAQGKVKGKKRQGIDIQAFLRDSLQMPAPDLIFEMSRDFEIPGDNTEQFRIFVIPTQLPHDVYVRGVEFLPGNRKLAHHARIMVDTTNLLRADDGIRVGATSEFEKTGVKLYDNFWQGWVPGNSLNFYPEGIAKRLPRNADLVVNVHYSPTPVAATDRSRIRLFLAKKAPERPVKTFILDESWVSNPPFEIPANTTKKFFMRSPVIPTDISLLSVLPHMHKLGKTFKTYAVSPSGRVIPLLKIDNWDFNWQITYQFEGFVRLPKGSVVYAEAEYDNTSDNPVNPNFPPRDVGYGWGTAEEMMNLIFEYVE
jgi:mono/diheme cytochrome c family protein